MLAKFFSDEKEIIRKIVIILATGIGIYGVNYVYSMAVSSYFSNGIISCAAFVMLYRMLLDTQKRLQMIENKVERKRHIIWAGAIAFLFSVLMIMGYQLRTAGLTECGVKGKGLIILRGICLSVAVFPFVSMIIRWIEKLSCDNQKSEAKRRWGSVKVWLVNWLVIFALWIPVFLAYYPSIMSYDFHRQSQEAMIGFAAYNSHHPLAHTWILSIFLHLGELIGSLETGMAIFSVCQMLIFSAALAYCATMVYRLTGKIVPNIVAILFFTLFPFISVLSVCTTKDVLFSAFFAVFVVLFVEHSLFAEGKKRIAIDIFLVLDGILMILFRNNALYAVAVFAVVWVLFAKKKERIRILALCLVLVIGGKASLEGIQQSINPVGRGSSIEMCSVLLAQFARVGYYHGDELDEETYALLDKYVSDEYWELYNPTIIDAVKSWVAWSDYNSVWKNNMGDVFRAWISIGLKYPNEYIDAFLTLTCGYWFFDDVSWAVVLGDDLEGRRGPVHTFNSNISDVIPEGIAHESLFPQLELFLEEIVTGNASFDWPVISVLFKPALYCWLLLLCFLLFIYTKQKQKCLITVYPLIYVATLLLGPVVQIRYLLPVVVVIPVLLGLWCFPMTGKDDKALQEKRGEESVS